MPRLKPLVRLKSLWLHDTRVSDAAIPALAQMDGLENLYVYRTNMTIDGVRELKRKLPSCKIFYRSEREFE